MSNETKVLVVEDQETWRALYEDTLKRAGYLPFSADNIGSALELIERHFFHAALLDVVLNDLVHEEEQGMEVLDRLTQRGEQTGVVMVTGYPTINRMDKAYAKYGVIRFLSKRNFEADELLLELAKGSLQSKSYLASIKSDTLQPQNLVRRFSLHDLEVRLPVCPNGLIAELLQSLLSAFLPLQVCGEFERIESLGETTVFETHYWSRMAGKEIAIRIGTREHIVQERHKLVEHGQDVALETRQNIGGLRFVVERTSPNRFGSASVYTPNK